MDSNKRLKTGSGDEDESSVGMKPSQNESKITSGGSQSGEGSRSHQMVFGGFSVDSTDFGEIFQSTSFAERMLYCIPNNIEEVDSHIISKFYQLVILQLRKEAGDNIASKVNKLFELPRKCFDETITEISLNLVFPISEKSKMRMSLSAKAMKTILEGLHADKHRIDLAVLLDLTSVFWQCRKGLEALPEDLMDSTVEAIRSFDMALVEFIRAVLEDKSGVEASHAACSVIIPLADAYNPKFDDELLPLFCTVLNKNKEVIVQDRLLETIIHSSFQPIEGNHTSMKFSTSICDLVEILWEGYYQYIFKTQTLWQKVMSWTFWALRYENIEIAERASNILVRVGKSLEELDFRNNMDASPYVLNMVHDIFLGFSKNQDPLLFNLHINLALMALSLTRQNDQVFNIMDVKTKIVEAFSITFHYTLSDEIDNVVSSIMVSQDDDNMKDCLNSFLEDGGSTLSDLMKG